MLPEVIPVLPSKRTEDQLYVTTNPDLYVYEQKLDGFRCFAYLDHKAVRLGTKLGKSHSGFREVEEGLKSLQFQELILDGELVALNEQGQPDFQALVHRSGPIYYYAFDMLYANSNDMRMLPLLERKRFLRAVLEMAPPHIRYLRHYTGAEALNFADEVMKFDLEGLVAKLVDGPYDPRHQRNWVKIPNLKYSQGADRARLFGRK